MAFKTLSIRIPEEAHEELEKLAEQRQQKVSDVARELIVNGLKGGSQADNQLVLEYLEGFGRVLAGIHQEAAKSHYYSELMASYAVDIQNLMVEGKVAEKGAKEALMGRFGAASMDMARESWIRALGVKPEQEPR
jgi:predicted DNA-binding protein